MKPPFKTAKKIPEYWLYWTYLNPALLTPHLQTTEGRPVTVFHPGYRNQDNGPDFLRAIIEIDGLRCQGDVEFHCAAEDWFRHGHHHDERYRNVILHILWENGGKIPGELRSRFPHLALRGQLSLPEEHWRERMLLLEEDAGKPSAIPAGGDLALSPCYIADLAEQRFQHKMDRYRSWCACFSPEDVFYIALAEALGYSKNKFPFRQLLWECPPSQVYKTIPPLQRSPFSIWVYWALRGNLLNLQIISRDTSRNVSSSEAAVALYQYFQQRGFYPLLSLSDWNFSRIRPANSPYLRLGALAQWLYQYQSPGLFEKLLSITMERRPLRETIRSWQSCLQLPFDPAIAEAVRQRLKVERVPGAVIGVSRLKQIFLNVLLPLFSVWAERSNNIGFRNYLGGLYESFPASEENRIIEAQSRLVSDPALRVQIRRSGFYQQGLYEYMAAHS